MKSSVMNTYLRQQVEFTHGRGAWLFDAAGKAYLDGLSGIAVCGLGHAHPAVTQAIADQAGRLLHSSNLFEIGVQRELGDALCRVSGMSSAFFANSGAEANEAAIKMARLYGHGKGVHTPSIVVMDAAFHGRTMATLTASGNRKIQTGFEPLVAGFVRAPYGDLSALENIGHNNNQVVAVMLEPIQGESGIRVPPPGYLAAVRSLCDAHGWLLILDEVQTGNGRTGSYFLYQQEGIQPDIVTTAKGLGNGVPIGACLAAPTAAEIFQPGNHGSTFGGNPLACRAALTAIAEIEALGDRVQTLGKRLVETLQAGLAGLAAVREIRGKGLMIGIELAGDCSGLVAQGLAAGVVINVTGGSVIRLLPPLIMTDEEIDLLAERVIDLVTAHDAALAGHGTALASV